MQLFKEIEFQWLAALLILLFTIGLRVLLSAMKSYEYESKFLPEAATNKHALFTALDFKKRFGLIFWGNSREEPNADLGYNFFLGLIELSAYYYLMNEGQFSYIAWWLGFKIAAQWNTWKESRHAINRFFIAISLQLIFCYVISGFPNIKP